MVPHVRLLELEMYLPQVQNHPELIKALGALKRFCKNEQMMALAIKPFTQPERGEFSVVILGYDKTEVEQSSHKLLLWVESNVSGQSLSTTANWL